MMQRLSFMALSPELGCQTTLYCALDEKLANESGHYYANCTKFTNSSFAVSTYLTKNALDDELAKKLWDFSCELVKLEYEYNIPSANDKNESNGQRKNFQIRSCKSRVKPAQSN